MSWWRTVREMLTRDYDPLLPAELKDGYAPCTHCGEYAGVGVGYVSRSFGRLCSDECAEDAQTLRMAA